MNTRFGRHGRHGRGRRFHRRFGPGGYGPAFAPAYPIYDYDMACWRDARGRVWCPAPEMGDAPPPPVARPWYKRPLLVGGIALLAYAALR